TPAPCQSVRRLALNELLLAAQEHDKKLPEDQNLEDLKDQIVLLRLAQDRLQPANVFSAAIATIQGNSYIQPAPIAVGWLIVLAAALLASFLWMISKDNLLSGAVIFSAGYALVALSLLGQNRLWIPVFLPLALLSFLIAIRILGREPKHEIAVTA